MEKAPEQTNNTVAKNNTPKTPKNLIKVSYRGKPLNYALYASKQLLSKENETVIIQGMGQASSKVIASVEFMR